MPVGQFNHIDARGSTLVSVGRDQVNTVITININAPPTISRQSRRRLRSNGYPGTLCHIIPKDNSSAVFSNVDTAIRQIANIVHLLRADSQDEYRQLEQELKTTCESLTLIGSAIQAYKYTPLCETLAKAILPEVEQCCTLLQEMSSKIIPCRDGLMLTAIHDLWRQVWWNTLGDNELAKWKKELSTRQNLLHIFLTSLNSCVCFTYS
jgi:hypothetical protein